VLFHNLKKAKKKERTKVTIVLRTNVEKPEAPPKSECEEVLLVFPRVFFKSNGKLNEPARYICVLLQEDIHGP
jgi:hypothetical protein